MDPQLVPVVKQSIYVDNYYNGGEVTDEVVTQFVKVCNAMQQLSLHLSKVMSNSEKILAKFPNEDLQHRIFVAEKI